MKSHTRQEEEAAQKKLPQSLADFLGSETLSKLYLGIRDKLKLNLRQLMAMSGVVNATLLGLEEEGSLEANLHQYLPELSNADMRELVADINDRILKEARRRLRENILEPKEEVPANADEDDDNDSDEIEPETTPLKPVPKSILKQLGTKQPDDSLISDTAETKQDTTVEPTKPARTIVEEKLGAPTESKLEAVSVGQKPTALTDAPAQRPSGGTYHGQDPYREPVE